MGQEISKICDCRESRDICKSEEVSKYNKININKKLYSFSLV